MTGIKGQLERLGKDLENAVINGNFEFISCDRQIATIKIDSVQFELWIANNPANDFGFYSNFLEVAPFSFTTDETRLKGWGAIKKYVDAIAKEIRLKQIEKLQKELENYEK